MGRTKEDYGIRAKRDFSGEIIKLTLVKVKDYGKFTLYTVTKIIGNEKIPLYNESFTPEQVNAFYNTSILQEVG